MKQATMNLPLQHVGLQGDLQHLAAFASRHVYICRIQRCYRRARRRHWRRAVRVDGAPTDDQLNSEAQYLHESRSLSASLARRPTVFGVDRVDTNARMKSQLLVKMGSAKFVLRF